MTSTLFTAAIILGAVFIFIIFFSFLHKRGNNKKVAQQKLVFADIVWKNKLQISEKQSINNYLLAIDRINFALLYINFSSAKEEVVLIDLWKIRTVKVTTENNSVYEQRKGKSVLVDKQVNKLQLEITMIDNQPTANLVLFEYRDGMQDFLKIKGYANHWAQLINKEVKELPQQRQSSPYE